MRLFAFIAAMTLAAAGPAGAQTWTEYTYRDAGFAVQFPDMPKVEMGSYPLASGESAPATIYSAHLGNRSYTVTVADLTNTKGDQANAIDVAVNDLRQTGDIKVDVRERINGQFGHELNVAGKDGSASTLAIFFFNHHLYKLEAKVAPPNPQAGSGDAVRFQQSLQFIGAGGRGFGRGGFGFGGF